MRGAKRQKSEHLQRQRSDRSCKISTTDWRPLRSRMQQRERQQSSGLHSLRKK